MRVILLIAGGIIGAVWGWACYRLIFNFSNGQEATMVQIVFLGVILLAIFASWITSYPKLFLQFNAEEKANALKTFPRVMLILIGVSLLAFAGISFGMLNPEKMDPEVVNEQKLTSLILATAGVSFVTYGYFMRVYLKGISELDPTEEDKPQAP